MIAQICKLSPKQMPIWTQSPVSGISTTLDCTTKVCLLLRRIDSSLTCLLIGAFVTQFIAPFHRLVINADVYRSWAVRDLAARQKGATEQAGLSHEEAKFLAIGVESAQTLLLYLSLNARADNGRRIPRFEDPQYWKDGLPIYKPMEPDQDHARHVRTAVDTVVTVIITFSAMFLAKLRAAVSPLVALRSTFD